MLRSLVGSEMCIRDSQHSLVEEDSTETMGYADPLGVAAPASPTRRYVEEVKPEFMSSPEKNTRSPEAVDQPLEEEMVFRGSWENVKMKLVLQPSRHFTYDEEIEISDEFGIQRKDYSGSYTIYDDTIMLECRWRDEHRHGIEPSDKVLEGIVGSNKSAVTINYSKRGPVRLCASVQ
eukprot:TRINITY_DN27598_c0_g1_i2.p1 TRINITY_DN27598_c0_g1~~TRINITY_DN27598_c0_g1_i2.p1  ORF type:complete len:192 (+),score=88.99 TRINITY_DN27598_c0_g1_i2:46-576(+)